jgi:6-phosphogluconolactonase
VAQSGQSIYVANSSEGTVSTYAISSGTGNLTLSGTIAVPSGDQVDGLVVDPSGKYAHVSDVDDEVSMYVVNSGTGILSLNTPAVVATGNVPGSPAVDPSGRFAYVSTGTDFGAIYMYTVNSGILTPNTPSNILTGGAPQQLAVDSSGKFLYITIGNSDEVWIYGLSSDGTLTMTGMAGTGNSPTGIVLTSATQ